VRIVSLLLLLALAVVLGAVQFVASIAVRREAQPGSWMRLVPEPVARRIERADPALPLPPALRLLLAKRALERGDAAATRAYLERLPKSGDRLALEGGLAESRGDVKSALADYLAAGDLDDVERHALDLAEGYHFDRALPLQRAVVDRLQSDPTQTDALARAYYELGWLDEAYSYRLAIASSGRNAAERDAAAAYERAVTLAPLSERYLIAYGNQLLNVRRPDAAQAIFARARDVDPIAADPLVGLAEASFRRGDTAAARAYFARARDIDPSDPAVLRLARELGV
jgi:tetratricopeptide (TPR) repeat protein